MSVREEDVQRLAAIVEHCEDAILAISPEGVITSWNAGAAQLYGWSARETVGSRLSMIAPPGFEPDAEELLAALRNGARVAPFEAIRLRKDGMPVIVSVSLSPIRGADGELVGVIHIGRDISTMRRSEPAEVDALRQAWLQVEQLPLAYLLTDGEFRCLRWNLAAQRLFGFSEDDVLGRTPFEFLVSPQSRQLVSSLLDRVRHGATDAHGIWDSLTKEGRAVTCEWHNTALIGDDGVFLGLLALAQDLTERRRREESYLQTRKMELIGRLASGIAHDFNNLQLVIGGYGDLVMKSLSTPGPVLEWVREMVEASERTGALARRLLAFTRQRWVAPTVLDLNAVVADLSLLLRQLAGEGVELIFDLQPGLGSVRADAGQIEQAVLTLAAHLCDEAPGEGKLLLTTRDAESFIVLSVSGTSPAPKLRYETEAGGLRAVRELVERSGGRLEQENGKDTTTFRVEFPRVGSVMPTHPTVAEPIPRGTETILVAEDEKAVGRLIRQALETAGYTVLMVADGVDALETAGSHAGAIHLLVCDVVMPRLGGLAVAQRLRETRPELKVLFLSGYSARDLEMTEAPNFLAKPFLVPTLARKVREVLDH
jgi:two-component system, cell cycle sensor histidine kinase and response regulator CckA